MPETDPAPLARQNQAIRAAMDEQGLTERDLAAEQGVSHVAIHKLITGGGSGSARRAAIAERLGLELRPVDE